MKVSDVILLVGVSVPVVIKVTAVGLTVVVAVVVSVAAVMLAV